MELKALGDVANVYLSGAGVSFVIQDGPPKWPQLCVVCGKYCAETAEFDSVRERRFGRFVWTSKGLRSFVVPVHKTNSACLAHLRRPVPVWALLAAVLVGLVGGGFMSYVAHSDAADRLGAFFVFGAVALAAAVLPMAFVFADYLQIWELGAGRYSAQFKSEEYPAIS